MAQLWIAFTRKLQEELVSKAVWIVLALIAFIASWLWGWFAAGGLQTAFGAVQPGMVAAFDRDAGCPPGWDDFKEGRGRVLVGAVTKDQLGTIPNTFGRDRNGRDLTEKPFGKPGGAE
jgi:hypothetical protein